MEVENQGPPPSPSKPTTKSNTTNTNKKTQTSKPQKKRPADTAFSLSQTQKLAERGNEKLLGGSKKKTCHSHKPSKKKNPTAIDCPIPSCSNNHNRGFKTTSLKNHIQNFHSETLSPTHQLHPTVKACLGVAGLRICTDCHNIMKTTNAAGLCSNCAEQAPPEGKIQPSLNSSRRQALTNRIQKTNNYYMQTLTELPPKLWRRFESAMAKTHKKLANSETELQQYEALLEQAQLKALIVRPFSGGRKRSRRNQKALNASID